MYNFISEVIPINIEIQKPNKFKSILNRSKNKIEDAMFSLILKLPEKHIPSSLMGWLEQYTNKRIAELNHAIIKDTWKQMELKKSIDRHSQS